MKNKQKPIAVLFPLIAVFLLAVCSLPPVPGGKGSVTILLPGAQNSESRSAVKLPESITNSMIYVLNFTGPGKQGPVYARSGDTKSLELVIGTWTIDAVAYYDLEKVVDIMDGIKPEFKAGTAQKTITVNAGPNNATVSLSVEEDFLKPKLYDDEGEATIHRYWVSDEKTSLYADVFSNISELMGNNLTIRYQWYSNEENSNENGTPLAQGKNDTLSLNTIPGNWLNTTTYFYCTVTYEYNIENKDPEKYDKTTDPQGIGVYSENLKGLKAWIDDADSGEEIVLPRDYFDENNPLEISETVEIDKNITLVGIPSEGRNDIEPLVIQRDTVATMFAIAPGATLTLQGFIEINGNYYDPASSSYVTDSAITVNGGSLVMDDNVVINYNNAEYGGAVIIYKMGAFTMKGGTIEYNHANDGGGVYVSHGAFTMEGGIIGGNTADRRYISSSDFDNGFGGGVYVAEGGTFIMTGGSIGSNDPLEDHPNHAFNGGGVFVAGGGTFTMTNTAKISGNSAFDNLLSFSLADGGGVYVDGGLFTMDGGSVSYNEAMNGGGVYVAAGSFYLDSGSIDENTAGEEYQTITEGYGGGVYVDYGSFNMDGGVISGNGAAKGGGVYVVDKILTINEISGRPDGIINRGGVKKSNGIIYGDDANDNKNFTYQSYSDENGDAIYIQSAEVVNNDTFQSSGYYRNDTLKETDNIDLDEDYNNLDRVT